MKETFTLPCTECGKDYKTTTPQAPVPQWCKRCTTKMYEQKPIIEYSFIKKGRLYFKRNYCGYTEHVARAGLYERSVAETYQAKSNGAAVAVPIHECYWTIPELDDQIRTLQTIRDAKQREKNNEYPTR